jgi:hypothetical protein
MAALSCPFPGLLRIEVRVRGSFPKTMPFEIFIYLFNFIGIISNRKPCVTSDVAMCNKKTRGG